MPDALGDPMLIDQVWRNLFSNAFKFSAGRDPALIEAGFDAAANAWFVRDNGAGFDMKYVDKLFRPSFPGFTGSTSSKDQFEGVGIGLAHAARIVQRHGAAYGPRLHRARAPRSSWGSPSVKPEIYPARG